MVSLVVPDLLDTTKSARLRLTPSATCLTAPGSVESSTSMSGKPIFEPKVSLKTAPVDEEPPMPSRTTWEYCSRRTSSAKPRMSSECPRMMVGEVSQPSRFRTVAASPFHRVASFTQRRSRNSRDSRKRSVSSTAGSLSGSGSTGGGLTTAGGGAGARARRGCAGRWPPAASRAPRAWRRPWSGRLRGGRGLRVRRARLDRGLVGAEQPRLELADLGHLCGPAARRARTGWR